MIKKRSNRTSKPKNGQTDNALKRVKATKLNLATLAATIQKLTLHTRRDLADSQQKILVLDEKIGKIDQNLDLTHQAVCAVNEMIVGHTDTISGGLIEAERQHDEMFTVIGTRVDAVTARVRSIEECQANRYAAALEKLEVLEERMPQMETKIKTLEGNLDTIENLYAKINLRIVSVMWMSLAIIGVLMVTLGVLGWILYRH